jgi:hypothetical protein
MLLKPDPNKPEPKNICHTRLPDGGRDGTKDLFFS